VAAALVADARALVAAVGYRSAGTVEFVVDADTGEHFFLEVNTRLQVEHGVTELTHGVDLVAWMVRLAAGDRSMFDAPVPAPHGHAVEARVYAESPAHGFQPSPGRITHVRLPEGVRCDGWVEPGTEVTPFYDPLLLKVLASGPDRASAVARLDRALADLQLEGIETNVEHLRAILAAPRFAAGEVTTGLVAELPFTPPAVEVVDAGAGRGGQALVVSYPGRTGLWSVGVPPSGPMDDWSFRLGNALLGNPADAAGLELSVAGPTLHFHRPATVCLTGADMGASLDEPAPERGAGSAPRSRAGSSLQRDRPLRAVARRLPGLVLQRRRHLGVGDDGQALVVEVEDLGADVPAPGMALAQLGIDGHLHQCSSERGVQGPRTVGQGPAYEVKPMAAGSAGSKSYTRQALPTVILSWVSWGRWSSHLAASCTVSGQVESECG
jgi:urea carboxylase